MSDFIIRAKNIKKYFGGVKALDGVDLEIKKGEVHCLAGENGCGKSTIINIISGFYVPTAGTIEVDGKEYSKMNTKLAIDSGIQVIYQDLSVFPNLTVMENLAITSELSKGKKFVNKKAYEETAKEALSKIGIHINLYDLVENLSIAEKQLIAISRALLNDAKLIIMDEPTTAITKKEVKSLFEIIRQLQKKGISILFVSHKLDEVFEIAERFTIFRNGKNVASGDTKDLDRRKFAYYMTGRDIMEESYLYEESEEKQTVLEVENLSREGEFEKVSFSVKQGEILGITGLLGSGRTELVETIFGYRKADSGSIKMLGERVSIETVKDAICHRIGYVPSDRINQGLFLEQSISDNISIEKWDTYKNRAGKLNRKKMIQDVKYWVEELAIVLHDIEDNVGMLSGGNQQKCVLAKWLLLDLKLLILNGPTVGVDIGAKFDIYRIIKELARKGLSVIIISDDIPEILSNCNRIFVMRNGRLAEHFENHEIDEVTLAKTAFEG